MNKIAPRRQEDGYPRWNRLAAAPRLATPSPPRPTGNSVAFDAYDRKFWASRDCSLRCSARAYTRLSRCKGGTKLDVPAAGCRAVTVCLCALCAHSRPPARSAGALSVAEQLPARAWRCVCPASASTCSSGWGSVTRLDKLGSLDLMLFAGCPWSSLGG